MILHFQCCMSLVLLLRCFNCGGKDKKECEKYQRIQYCSRESGENSCLTLSYTYTKKDSPTTVVTKSRYRKLCARSYGEHCNVYCKSRRLLKYKECKVREIYERFFCLSLIDNSNFLIVEFTQANLSLQWLVNVYKTFFLFQSKI